MSQKGGADLEDGMAPPKKMSKIHDKFVSLLFILSFILVQNLDKIGAGG
jgi:hypothetical protein